MHHPCAHSGASLVAALHSFTASAVRPCAATARDSDEMCRMPPRSPAAGASADRPPERRLGFFVQPEVVERDSEVVMVKRLARRFPHRALEQRQLATRPGHRVMAIPPDVVLVQDDP